MEVWAFFCLQFQLQHKFTSALCFLSLQITGIISWIHHLLCSVSIDDCWFKRYWLDLPPHLLLIRCVFCSDIWTNSLFAFTILFLSKQSFTDGSKLFLQLWVCLRRYLCFWTLLTQFWFWTTPVLVSWLVLFSHTLSLN